MKKLFLVKLWQTTIQEELVYAESEEQAREITENAGWISKEEVVESEVQAEEILPIVRAGMHPSKIILTGCSSDGEASYVRLCSLSIHV